MGELLLEGGDGDGRNVLKRYDMFVEEINEVNRALLYTNLAVRLAVRERLMGGYSTRRRKKMISPKYHHHALS